MQQQVGNFILHRTRVNENCIEFFGEDHPNFHPLYLERVAGEGPLDEDEHRQMIYFLGLGGSVLLKRSE